MKRYNANQDHPQHLTNNVGDSMWKFRSVMKLLCGRHFKKRVNVFNSIIMLMMSSIPCSAQITNPDDYVDIQNEDVWGRTSSYELSASEKPFGINYDANSGQISFEVVDVAIPGNFDIPVELRRVLKFDAAQKSSSGDFLNWSIDIPRIYAKSLYREGTTQKTGWYAGTACTSPMGEIELSTGSTQAFTKIEPFKYYNGATLVIPGKTSETILKTSDGWRTKSNYKITCLSADTFTVTSPEGTIYTMNHRVRNVTGYHNRANGIWEFAELALVTNIEDRFGNWVEYEYNQYGGLNRIHSSDGREITISRTNGTTQWMDYSPGRVESVTANGRTWSYDYVSLYLSDVTLPDGTTWEYSSETTGQYSKTRSASSTSGYSCSVVSQEPDIITIKNPAGATAALTLTTTYHGRANVYRLSRPHTYTNPNMTAIPETYVVTPKCSAARALTRKQISGAGFGNIVTTYNYSSNPGYFDPNSTPSETITNFTYGVPVPPSINTYDKRLKHKYTIENKPDGSKTVYFFNRDGSSFLEGTLVAQDDYDTDGITRLKRTEISHSQGSYVGNPQTMDNLDNIAPQAYRINTIQAKSSYSYSNGTDIFYTDNLEFDTYGFVTKSKSSNNFNGKIKYVKNTFSHYPTDWVIGLPTKYEVSATDSNYTTVSELTYHTSSYSGWYLPYQIKQYGTWITRFSQYHTTAGYKGSPKKVEYNQTLKTSSGSNSSTYRYRTLTNFKRGIPQTVTLPARYSHTATMTYNQTVDNNGWVTSITSLNGKTASYTHDPLGRVESLDLPDSWLDHYLDWSYNSAGYFQRDLYSCTLNSTKTGCNSGTVKLKTTGIHDALLRNVTTHLHDPSSNDYRYTERQFDFAYRNIFSSFADANAGETEGTFSQYDGLGRVISTNISHGGTVTTEYLAGNKIRTTDGEGNVSTTTYLAYDSPIYEQATFIDSPENVDTSINVNLFGDVTSITQSGPGKNGVGTVSQTEYRAYDARHHLCKIVRNDVGTTAFNNTVLGEVNWSAEGVSGGTVTNCTATVSTAQKVVNLYDNLGDIWKVTYADTSPDKTYTRDNNGNLLTLTAGGVSTTYLYNALDLVEKETMVVDGQSFVLDYHYATSGALSGITYPNGHRVNFAPNGFGEPTEAKRQAASGVNSLTYADNATYHANGMLATFTYGNGLNYALILNNRRLPETFTDSRTGLVAASQTYHYDDNQNFIKILDNVNSAYSLTSLAYDGLDRLTSATGGSGIGSSTMSYDSLGNITKLNTKNRTLDYTYNTTTNRLSSVNSGLTEQKDYTSFAYDSRGNITNNSHRSFSYNRANQMYASGSYQYVYDGHNRRVKTVDSDGTSYSMYGYDGTLRYIKSPTQTVNYIQLGAKLIAKDGVTQSSNSSTQHIRPFGSSIEGENEDAGYTGHKFDTDLGLGYMQARYYDPVIGRFYSNDPVDAVSHLSNEEGIRGFNRYSYAVNNPYKYTDPDGKAICGGLCVGAAAAVVTCAKSTACRTTVAGVLVTVGLINAGEDIGEATENLAESANSLRQNKEDQMKAALEGDISTVNDLTDETGQLTSEMAEALGETGKALSGAVPGTSMSGPAPTSSTDVQVAGAVEAIKKVTSTDEKE